MDAIEIKDGALIDALERAIDVSGRKPEVFLGPIGAMIAESTRLRFVDSVGPDGRRWKPVLRDHGRGKPLRNTGVHLMNAISYALQGDSVTVGVPHAWAAIHQLGGVINRAPYSMNVRLATTAHGRLLRQKGHTNLARFAKSGSKHARSSWHEVKPYAIRIPARPFFGINQADEQEGLRVLDRLLTKP